MLGFATLVASGLALTLAAASRRVGEAIARTRAFPFLVFTAVGFVLALDLTWDSYSAPVEWFRYIERGPIGPLWLVFLASCAAVAIALRRRAPSGAMLATAALCWLCALSALFVGGGHRPMIVILLSLCDTRMTIIKKRCIGAGAAGGDAR